MLVPCLSAMVFTALNGFAMTTMAMMTTTATSAATYGLSPRPLAKRRPSSWRRALEPLRSSRSRACPERELVYESRAYLEDAL